MKIDKTTVPKGQSQSCHHENENTLGDFSWVRVTQLLKESKICQCLDCGLIYSANFPTGKALELLNQELSVSWDVPDSRSIEKVGFVRSLFAGAGIALHNQPVVDVGGGSGRTARAFREAGLPNAWTYDPYSAPDPSVSNDTRLNNSELADFFRSKSGIDGGVMTLFHVLEHVENPSQWLRETMDTFDFSDGDYIVIEVPVLELEPLFPTDPNSFFAPFHISHFTVGSLLETVEAAGLYVLGAKAALDYNGWLILCARGSQSRGLRAITRADPFALVKNYQAARSDAEAKLAQNLQNLCRQNGTVVIWGLGVGFDALMRLFPSHPDNDFVFIDSDRSRREAFLGNWSDNFKSARISSPENFLSIRFGSSAAVVSGSYAKEVEILNTADKHRDSSLFNYFSFSPIRAY